MKRVGGIRDLPHAASKQSIAGARGSRRPTVAAGCGGNAGDGFHPFVHPPPLRRKDKAEQDKEQKQWQNHTSSTQPHYYRPMLSPSFPSAHRCQCAEELKPWDFHRSKWPPTRKEGTQLSKLRWKANRSKATSFLSGFPGNRERRPIYWIFMLWGMGFLSPWPHFAEERRGGAFEGLLSLEHDCWASGSALMKMTLR